MSANFRWSGGGIDIEVLIVWVIGIGVKIVVTCDQFSGSSAVADFRTKSS